nr:hypothetical protein [Rosenbergiella epipactidis]
MMGALMVALSGCSAQLKPMLEDYNGSDAAHIRVATGDSIYAYFYEKQSSGCYKQVMERRLSSGFSVMGFPVTGSKKMGMPSSKNYGYQPTNEFSIKPNQLVSIVHYWVDAHVNYSFQESSSERFIPKKNHNYDIIVKGTDYSVDHVSITDLDPQAKIVGWEGDICKK